VEHGGTGTLEITSFPGSFVQNSPLGLVHACTAILGGNMDDELLAAWARLPAEDKSSELKTDSKWVIPRPSFQPFSIFLHPFEKDFIRMKTFQVG